MFKIWKNIKSMRKRERRELGYIPYHRQDTDTDYINLQMSWPKSR